MLLNIICVVIVGGKMCNFYDLILLNCPFILWDFVFIGRSVEDCRGFLSGIRRWGEGQKF